MSNSGFFGNIKITVLIGYLILFALAVVGLVKIYQELVKFSQYQNPFSERKELGLVGNTLASLYEVESTRKAMLSNEFYTPALKERYARQNKKLYYYIDSLYRTTTDEYIKTGLDTINILLDEKVKNMESMLQLMDSIAKLPYSGMMKTTVLSRKDISGLTKIINEKIVNQKDTSVYVKEKKGFFDRVKAVFSSKEDSTKVITKSGISKNDSSYLAPSEILTDTIVQFINDVNLKSDKRKIAYMTKLARQQNTMLYYDECLTVQIKDILHKIEDSEKSIAIELASKKAGILKKSSNIVSGIGLTSLLVMIAFMVMSLALINKSRDFRNKLEQSKKYAEDLLKSRERLLLMISHDVKAPLSSIIGHIELLSKEKMPEEERRHLNNMRNSSEQILELTNKLMDYHRLEQGKSDLNIMPFSPHRLIADIHQSFLPIAAQKGLYLNVENHIDPALTYESDPFAIKQIVNNLIGNAIKFTMSGGVTLSTLINKYNDELLIAVEDTGVGIKEEDKEKIFKDFERAGAVEMRHKVEGYGLGLAITSKLIETLGGKITFSSEFGKGTSFKIRIPLKKAEETTIAVADAQKTGENEKEIFSKLLFVDDDVSILNVYSKLLERKGAEVSTCTVSTEVIPMLQNNDFDIIFTDIQMPRMNGFELVKNIRNLKGKYLEIPVIALSARSDVSEKDFKAAGFTTFITKPVPFHLMVDVIKQVEKTTGSTEKRHDALTQTTLPPKGIHSLIEFMQDDPNTSKDILNTFVEENKNKLLEIETALQAGDWAVIKSNAHKMLPLMRMMGEDEIVSMLEKVETGEQNKASTEKLISMIENKNTDILDYIAKNLG